MDTATYYAEKFDRAPQIFGDTRLPSLQFCQRYNRDAHYDSVKDSSGVARWVTQKQMRVYGIVARISLSEDGFARMLDIAKEAGCHTTTVSRTLLKLQAWGLYCVDVKRGRNGGVHVRKPWGEHARLYIRAARQRLWELSRRTREKVASTLQRATDGVTSLREDMDATFRPARLSFTSLVLYERAMLALSDPEGEYEAVQPLIDQEDIDHALLNAQDVRRRQDEAIREAAFRGDWAEWERLRKVRWE